MAWMSLDAGTFKRKRCARYRHMRRARASPMYPILVSGGSEGAILHWDLSSATSGTYSRFVFHRNRFCLSGITHHIRKYGRALGARPTNLPARSPKRTTPNVRALTFHPLGHPLARFKRPQDLLLGRASVPATIPSLRPAVPRRARTTSTRLSFPAR